MADLFYILEIAAYLIRKALYNALFAIRKWASGELGGREHKPKQWTLKHSGWEV